MFSLTCSLKKYRQRYENNITKRIPNCDKLIVELLSSWPYKWNNKKQTSPPPPHPKKKKKPQKKLGLVPSIFKTDLIPIGSFKNKTKTCNVTDDTVF